MDESDDDLGDSGTQVEIWGWESFFEEVARLLESCGRSFDSASESMANYTVERLSTCIVSLQNILTVLVSESSLGEVKENVEHLLTICRLLSVEWEKKIDQMCLEDNDHAYTAPVTSPGSGTGRMLGRPPFDISKDQLLYLSSLSFTWTDIARILGVSRMTIYRRRVKYGIQQDASTVLTDIQLRALLQDIKSENPHLGEVMVLGRIRSLGYKVTRERLRHAIRQTDPLHLALRWPGAMTSRRPYSVHGPNSLWHIGEI